MVTTTTTAVNSTTSSVQLLAADPTRSSVVMVNTDSNRLYFRFGTDSATTSAGGFTDYLDADDDLAVSGDQAKLAIQGIWIADGSGAASITAVTSEQLAGAGADSILGIIQQVCKRPLGIEPPDSVFASSDRTAQELARVANAALDMINRAHRWSKLVQRATYTGDGSTQDFDVPEDYGWMPNDQRVWSSTAQRPFMPCASLDDWLALDVQNFNPGDNVWAIFGGQIHFTPALDDGELAQHFYQSTASVQPASGTAKSTFTADTDTFRIDDELLRKAIIYLWKQDKGLPYAEFLNDYETLKEKLVARDKGAKVIAQGRARIPHGVSIAYPLNVPVT